MKMKKWVKMLCVIMAVSMIANIFIGCQSSTAEGTLEEQASLGGQTASEKSGNVGGTVNQVQATTMDASLNIDLGMFSLYGRPLGDWTYEELYGYVCDNFVEDLEYESNSTFNGEKVQERFFINPLDQNSATIRDERSTIQINANGVLYIMVKNEWCRSLWSLLSYAQNSDDLVASICGQNVESYLESICPGLYAKLQEEPTIALKDGMAMSDSLTNGMQRISLAVNGGNYELGYENGVITSLTVLFTENWNVTTDVTDAGTVLGQNETSGLNLNLGQWKFLGKTLVSWKIEDLADYIRATYKLESSSEDIEYYFLGAENSEDRILINSMLDGTLSITIFYANGVHFSIYGAEGRGAIYNINCEADQRSTLEELGATELAAVFGMTIRDFVESLKPGLFDTLTVDERVRLGDNANSMESILVSSDGSLDIQIGSVSIFLYTNLENGLINSCSITIY